MNAWVAGFDVGGTRVKSVAASLDGAILAQAATDTEDTRNGWRDAVREQLAAWEATMGPAQSAGVAAPGLAAADGRSIAWMMGRMAGVMGYDWTEALGRPVRVTNDAHAALLGEVWRGAARGCANVVMLTLGTGVGGAALVDGRLLRGAIGRAGHLGHVSLDPQGALDIVGTPGSLEDAIGEATLLDRTGGRHATTLSLLKDPDPAMQAVWQRSIEALAAACAGFINVLDPEVIVLGGGVAGAGTRLLDPLLARIEIIEWRPLGDAVRWEFAQLGDMAGALGAAYAAIHPS